MTAKTRKKFKVVIPRNLFEVKVDGRSQFDPVRNTTDRMLALSGGRDAYTVYVNNIEELTEFIKNKCIMLNPVNDCKDAKFIGPEITHKTIRYKTTCYINDFKLNESLMPAYFLEYELHINEIYQIVHDFNTIPVN